MKIRYAGLSLVVLFLISASVPVQNAKSPQVDLSPTETVNRYFQSKRAFAKNPEEAKIEWRILHEEIVPSQKKSGASGCDAFVVAESGLNLKSLKKGSAKILRFCLELKKDGWLIREQTPVLAGADPGLNRVSGVKSSQYAAICSPEDLSKAYRGLVEAIGSGKKKLLSDWVHDYVQDGFVQVRITGAENKSEIRDVMRNADFLHDLFLDGHLLNDFVFNTERYRTRFSKLPDLRYYDFKKRVYVTSDMSKEALSVRDLLKKVGNPVVGLMSSFEGASPYLESNIQISKTKNVPSNLLFPPKFVCLSDGWRMVRFFGKD